MNRRAVIKNLALVMGGAILLPSCLKKANGPSIALKHLNLNADQETMIGDICETFIPKTATPGAKDLNLHLFVIKMLDDCYKKKDQQAIMAGMVEFDGIVQKKYNKSFGELDVKDREAVLLGIESSGKAKHQQAPGRGVKPQKGVDAKPLDAFYWAMKQQTLFGYTTSQYFMTKQIVYELVPGRYNAHFPVKNLKTA
jgi:Gluconate 2-dehydrogenase subunit 3